MQKLSNPGQELEAQKNKFAQKRFFLQAIYLSYSGKNILNQFADVLTPPEHTWKEKIKNLNLEHQIHSLSPKSALNLLEANKHQNWIT